MVIVSNTTPITNLAKINQLGLLQELFEVIYIPEAVHQELLHKSVSIENRTRIEQASWIHVQEALDQGFVRQLLVDGVMDIGEAEAIALTRQLKADLALLDDSEARLYAKKHEIPFMGLIGVLIQLKKSGVILRIKPILDSLILEGFYVSQALYQKILSDHAE